MFLDAFGRFGEFWDILGQFFEGDDLGLSLDVLGYFGTLWDIFGCVGKFWDVL